MQRLLGKEELVDCMDVGNINVIAFFDELKC